MITPTTITCPDGPPTDSRLTGDACRVGGHLLASDGWRLCACARSLSDHADTPPDPAGGPGCGMTWRVCARCAFIDEHHVTDHDEHAHEHADPARDRHDQDEHRPGGNLRQDVTTGPVLPHQQATGENTMVKLHTARGVR